MRTVVRLAAALVLALGIVTPVLAKEGVEARLDQAIPLNGDPGTPIVVGFTLASMTGDDATGAPVYLRVHPVGGDPVEVPATDDGTGHYTATFTMPEHGVAAVEIGMRGESCENGACTRSDFMFQVAGPEHGGVFVPVERAAPGEPGQGDADAGTGARACRGDDHDLDAAGAAAARPGSADRGRRRGAGVLESAHDARRLNLTDPVACPPTMAGMTTLTAHTGTLDVPGGRLAFDIAGDGPPLLLVHAGVSDRRMWDDVWDELARSHTVIRHDTRGFGDTVITDPSVAYSNRADIVALLDHLDIAKAALCGVSRAGSIVIDTALEFPDRVSALIPVAAGLGGFEVEPTPQEIEVFTEQERLEEAKDWDAVIEGELRIWIDGIGQPADRVPEIRRRVEPHAAPHLRGAAG